MVLSKADRLVVYTAIAGSGRDALCDPTPATGVDYVCFTDQPLTSRVWDIRPFEYVHPVEAVRTAKHPKVLPHKYFPDHGMSVWVDGNITPKSDIGQVARNFLAQHNIAVHRHPWRTCLYKEAALVSSQGKDAPGPVETVVQRYFAAGVPPGGGLYECGVLFRRHNAPAVKAAMDLWWQEISTGTQSDQISWAYVVWKTGLVPNIIEADLRKSQHWTYQPHEMIKWGRMACSSS